MLVTFKTRARNPDITMFGDVAMTLIRLMGRRDTIPGEIEPDDIPDALKELRKGITFADSTEGDREAAQADDEEGEPVSLQNRAIPLIELLEAARDEDVPVIWEEGGRKF